MIQFGPSAYFYSTKHGLEVAGLVFLSFSFKCSFAPFHETRIQTLLASLPFGSLLISDQPLFQPLDLGLVAPKRSSYSLPRGQQCYHHPAP